MKVRDVMSRHAVTASPSMTAHEVAKLMEENDVGSVVVVENGRATGVITDRDIVTRCIAKGYNAVEYAVKDIMSTGGILGGLAQAQPDMDTVEAAQVMNKQKVRRLPVVENNRIVGVVSVADLAKDLRRYADSLLEEISEK